jgi:O-antigen/teichoic acid export membrane protein
VNWVRDSFYYFVSRAVPAAVGLALVAALVRILGVADYGAYALAFSGANLVSSFGVGWLTQATLRFQPAGGRELEAFQRLVHRAVTISSLISALLVAGLFVFSGSSLRTSVVVIAGAVLVFGLASHAVYSASLQAGLQVRQVAALEVGRALLSFPLAVWLAGVLRPNFVGALAGIALSYVCSGVVARWLATRAARRARGDAADGALTGISALVGYGWMLSVWLALSLALPYLERLVLANRLDIAAAGVYAATYDVIFRGCGFLMLPLVLALHPRIMRAAAKGEIGTSVRLWRAGLLGQLGLAVFIVFAISIAAPHLLRFAGLDASRSQVQLAIPLAIGGCLWQIALLAHKLLEVTLNTRTMIFLLAVSMSACIVADIILAPRMGLVAVAYSLAASGLLYCLLAAIVGRAQVATKLTPATREG